VFIPEPYTRHENKKKGQTSPSKAGLANYFADNLHSLLDYFIKRTVNLDL